MTMQAPGAPFSGVWVSQALPDADYAVLGESGVDFSTTISGNTASVAGRSVTVADVGSDIKSIAPNTTFGQRDRTAVVDNVTVTHQGRATVEMILTIYPNYEAGRSYDVFMANKEGHRFIMFQREVTAKSTAGVFDIMAVSEQAVDENGDITVDVTVRNSSHTAPLVS